MNITDPGFVSQDTIASLRIAADAVARLHAETSAPRIRLSSPVCYADELEEVYMERASDEELLASLNELLEAERAGARITLQSAAQAAEPQLRQLVADIHRDEVQWCGVLIAAIQSFGATPTTRTGAFYDKAMAVVDLRERMALLNRGQGWVVRKLKLLMPRIRDEHIQMKLGAMLSAHEQNMLRVDARLAGQGVEG